MFYFQRLRKATLLFLLVSFLSPTILIMIFASLVVMLNVSIAAWVLSLFGFSYKVIDTLKVVRKGILYWVYQIFGGYWERDDTVREDVEKILLNFLK